MLNVCFCDDNTIICDKYEALLKQCAEKQGVEISLKIYHSGEELVGAHEDGASFPDILYLDILMGKLDGIAAAGRMRAMGYTGVLIFLTSSEEYVFDAFDVAPLQYLVKDETDEATFSSIFEQAVQAASNPGEMLRCNCADGARAVLYNDISYLELNGQQATLHTASGELTFAADLPTLIPELTAHDFTQASADVWVHLTHVTRVENDSVELMGTGTMPIASQCAQGFKQAFSHYLVSSIG